MWEVDQRSPSWSALQPKQAAKEHPASVVGGNTQQSREGEARLGNGFISERFNFQTIIPL